MQKENINKFKYSQISLSLEASYTSGHGKSRKGTFCIKDGQLDYFSYRKVIKENVHIEPSSLKQ